MLFEAELPNIAKKIVTVKNFCNSYEKAVYL